MTKKTSYNNRKLIFRSNILEQNDGRFKSGETLVAGVGYNEGKYPSVKVKEHALWRSMLARCYTERNLLLKPAYRGCSVSDNFKQYSFFYEWCNKQVGFKVEGFALDKDLLIKGNKVYSEDTCVFVPLEINNLIVKSDSLRGDYPIGVTFDKERNKFQARIWINNKPKFLGRFEDIDSAFLAYKTAKESHLKVIAEKWKGLIDQRAYEALMNYQVEITD